MTLTYMNSGGRGRYRTADRWCVKRQDRVNGRSTVSSTSSSGAFPFRPASPCPRCSALSWDTGGSLANGRGCARRRCADCALHSAFPNIDEQPRMPTHWKALLIRVCYPVTDISAVEIRSRVGRWQFRLRCCLSTSQFLPHGASWTWPRGGGWAGGALLSWWGSLRCGSLLSWCGSLRLWCGSLLLSWGGQRLFCSRRRYRDRRHERLCRRWGHLWRWIRRDLPHGGWPDQCGEHRAVFARYRPALSVVFRRESLIGR